MEKENSLVLAVPVSIAKSLCHSPMEITRIKMMADAANFLADSGDASLITECSGSSIALDMHSHDVLTIVEAGVVEDLEIKTLIGSDDEASVVSMDVEHVVERSCLAVKDDGSIVSAKKELLVSDTTLIVVPGCIDKAVESIVTSVEIIPGSPIGKLTASLVRQGSGADDLKMPPFADVNIAGLVALRSRRSIFTFDYVPLWGCMSICGRRPEMEDAAIAVPWFNEIPLSMLTSVALMDDISLCSGCLPGHFFGVFDGHGGAQVANYCKKRMYLALADEIRSVSGVATCIESNNLQEKWETVFTNCFKQIDDEVGQGGARCTTGNTSSPSCDEGNLGTSMTLGPIIPETVGSTAVVAVICSSHIIVANCGDSRAVLYRGKQAMPLSVDHKPDREDEYQRIEAAGGKVIQWDGSRVFGVLAMSRSIGDGFLKPWIIPEPEVTVIPRSRDDECLILASDGLWDSVSNEEACNVARKKILLWHKKNAGTAPSKQRAEGTEGFDPAAQEAADYLSRLALQKGSEDNVTVIVVDLKAKRKFKNKS